MPTTMTKDTFKELLKGDDHLKYEKDNVLLGLNIIAKYLPNKGVEAAEHDIIYSVSVDEILAAGITEEDVIELANLNWIIEDQYLACFI